MAKAVYLLNMRRVIVLLLCLLPVLMQAQEPTWKRISRDSMNGQYELKAWRFMLADDTAMARPDFDDSRWPVVNPEFRFGSDDSDAIEFSSVGWFRFHFVAAGDLAGRAMAIDLRHYGASEVYLDGVRVHTSGRIRGDSSVYYNPATEPFVFVLKDSGHHVLAIRYANFVARRNYKLYHVGRSGFTASLYQANNAILSTVLFMKWNSSLPVLLFSIFITLSVLHLLLFAYYRSIRSNLYFSVFCFCMSLIFLFYHLNTTGSDPGLARYNFFVFMFIISVSCFSLSGLSNELFATKKLRFRIVTLACILTPIALYASIDNGLDNFLVITLCGFVLLESIVLPINAMRRKVQGATIIGAGILFFALFLFSIIIVAVTIGNLSFSGGIASLVFGVLAFCAILSIPGSMSVYLSRRFATMHRDIATQLQTVKELSDRHLEMEREKQHMLAQQNEQLERQVEARTAEVVKQRDEIELQHVALKAEKQKSDDLLLNILPYEVAEELKEKGESKAKYFDEVTVLFTDFVDFTKAAEKMSPEALVHELDTCFKAFDAIASTYGIEKIKTIGDAYLAVCGVPEPTRDHAEKVTMAALDICSFMKQRKQELGDKTFDVRVGLNTGSVVAGIVGVKKFAYDIWGDTVNTAARMEQHGVPGRVNVSQQTYDIIKGKFRCTHRGTVQAKSKGELHMYFVDGTL